MTARVRPAVVALLVSITVTLGLAGPPALAVAMAMPGDAYVDVDDDGHVDSNQSVIRKMGG